MTQPVTPSRIATVYHVPLKCSANAPTTTRNGNVKMTSTTRIMIASALPP
jgi:hypothetical protein